MDTTSPVGWLCILPPLLTIALAIISQRVVPSLLVGIVAALWILLPSPAVEQQILGQDFTWGRYLAESGRQLVLELFEGHLWVSLADSDHLRVFLFTSLLGMQVALIHCCGGMEGIIRWAAPMARSRRGGQLLTWLLGLIIFIDDYANTLLLGSTMRPLTDRLRISREKLAFLVDSTAAPVSGLALVSTWVATEISTMQAGFESAGVDIGGDAMGIFIQTIPSRFYILFMLTFVFLCGLTGRDFGPMRNAEQKASDQTMIGPESEQRDPQRIPGRPINALLPIVVTVAVALWLLIATGNAAVMDQGLKLSDDAWQAAGQIIGNGNSYVALVYGALSGLLVVLGLIYVQRELKGPEIRQSMLDGFVHVLPALVILWLAWTLSKLTGEGYLQTGQFLATQVNRWELSAQWMPTVVFVLASLIAFATGTSWGTMGILMPIAIPVVYGLLSQQMEAAVTPEHPILVASIASVLAGAIFGDHCSPISDTTILSSRSSGCDHIAHVRTQMPYALTVGAISICCGTIPAGLGMSPLWLLPLGVIAMLAVLFLVGARVRVEPSVTN